MISRDEQQSRFARMDAAKVAEVLSEDGYAIRTSAFPRLETDCDRLAKTSSPLPQHDI